MPFTIKTYNTEFTCPICSDQRVINKLDALLDVGPGNGFRFHWDNAKSSAIMYMNGKTVNIQYSQTITHEAPYTGDITEYAIGDPVFASGRVCKYISVKDTDGNITGGEWSYTTSAMDCICELKPEGQIGEFVGICVAFVDNEGKFTNEQNERRKYI